MKVNTYQKQYNLIEFHCYIDRPDGDECISIVELVIDTNELDYISEDFSNLFVVEAPHHSYVFSNYEVNEFYLTDEGYTKVVCVK